MIPALLAAGARLAPMLGRAGATAGAAEGSASAGAAEGGAASGGMRSIGRIGNFLGGAYGPTGGGHGGDKAPPPPAANMGGAVNNATSTMRSAFGGM